MTANVPSGPSGCGGSSRLWAATNRGSHMSSSRSFGSGSCAASSASSCRSVAACCVGKAVGLPRPLRRGPSPSQAARWRRCAAAYASRPRPPPPPLASSSRPPRDRGCRPLGTIGRQTVLQTVRTGRRAAPQIEHAASRASAGSMCWYVQVPHAYGPAHSFDTSVAAENGRVGVARFEFASRRGVFCLIVRHGDRDPFRGRIVAHPPVCLIVRHGDRVCCCFRQDQRIARRERAADTAGLADGPRSVPGLGAAAPEQRRRLNWISRPPFLRPPVSPPITTNTQPSSGIFRRQLIN